MCLYWFVCPVLITIWIIGDDTNKNCVRCFDGFLSSCALQCYVLCSIIIFTLNIQNDLFLLSIFSSLSLSLSTYIFSQPQFSFLVSLLSALNIHNKKIMHFLTLKCFFLAFTLDKINVFFLNLFYNTNNTSIYFLPFRASISLFAILNCTYKYNSFHV